MVETLPDDLRRQFDAEPVSVLLDYLAGRFGVDAGDATLETIFRDGRVVKGYLHRAAGRLALEELGRREAAPLS